VISGCSTGFGRALVQALLEQDYRVIATARKLSSIQDLQQAGAAILELDVTVSPEKFVEFAQQAIKIQWVSGLWRTLFVNLIFDACSGRVDVGQAACSGAVSACKKC